MTRYTRQNTKRARKHREKLYALVSEEPGGMTRMAYYVAPSMREVWEGVVALKLFGEGVDQYVLRAQGWRAKRIKVEEI